MSFVLKKTAEEVTERAIVPYVKEKIIESGASTAIVKWMPWGGVIMQSIGLGKDIAKGISYSGGVSWLVKQIMFWCLPQTQGVLITARCLTFVSGVVATFYSSGTVTVPLLLAGTIGSLRSILQ